MPFLAESYNTATIDVPLTERLIGQTWTPDQNANVDRILLYTGHYQDYVNRDATYDWHNEYERILLEQASPTTHKVWLSTDPPYVPHFRGSRDTTIPTGSRFMVRIRHAATTTPGTIQFTITNNAASETIIEVEAIPVHATADEIHTDFYLSTLTTVDWVDAQISYSVLSGAMTPLQIYLFPIFPMTASVQVAIHEVNDGVIEQSPIDNGVSIPVSASGWTSSGVQRTFSFATAPYIEYGQQYAFVVEYTEFFYETAQLNNSSIFIEADDTTLGYTNGAGYIYEDGAWGDSTEYGETDLRFEIWYEDTVTAPTDVDWPTDCNEQIAEMSNIIADIQAGMDSLIAKAASEYTVRSNAAPNTNTFGAEWVRDGLTLPLDEDFQYQWYNRNNDAFGGKYKYIKDEIQKNENEFIRGNVDTFPITATRYQMNDSSLRQAVKTDGYSVFFTVKWPAQVMLQLQFRAGFAWSGKRNLVHNINDIYSEFHWFTNDNEMPIIWFSEPGVGCHMPYYFLHPRVLHPGDYKWTVGMVNLGSGGSAVVGSGILPPGNLWMGQLGTIPTTSGEVCNIWQFRI
jgi:hypothetical protein